MSAVIGVLASVVFFLRVLAAMATQAESYRILAASLLLWAPFAWYCHRVWSHSRSSAKSSEISPLETLTAGSERL